MIQIQGQKFTSSHCDTKQSCQKYQTLLALIQGNSDPLLCHLSRRGQANGNIQPLQSRVVESSIDISSG